MMPTMVADSRKLVHVFTDGSCLGNPGPGGWAAILRFGVTEKVLAGGYSRTTNNRMEIMGALQALEALTEPCRVFLMTDSRYLCDAVEKKWLVSWQRNGWKTAGKKPVKNRDLWERLTPFMRDTRRTNGPIPLPGRPQHVHLCRRMRGLTVD